MSDELQLADEELNAQFLVLDDHVTSVKAAGLLVEKKQLEVVARRHYKKVRSALNGFNAQIRKVEDATQKSVFQKKFQSYDTRLKRADKALKDEIHPPKQSEKEKQMTREEQLMGEGGPDGTGFTNKTQVLVAGQRFQEDSLQAVARIERLQNSSEETGRETLTMLQRQTECMYQVDDELANLQGQLDRAKQDVVWFARQMAGDKCFLMIFMIVLVALMLLVFWMIYKRRKGNDDNELKTGGATPAPTPAPTDLVPAARTAGRYFARKVFGV